jgi:hypothetical protein
MADNAIYIFDQSGVKKSKIATHTSTNEPIDNEQYDTLSFQDENWPNRLESEFQSKYQGTANPYYNCHGLTFACKRTGIYSDVEIFKILKAEYRKIRKEDVIVGDVIIYSLPYDENSIAHSGIVVEVIKSEQIVGAIKIRIYSKVLKGREIVHDYDKGPYAAGYKTFYRINYDGRIRYENNSRRS